MYHDPYACCIIFKQKTSYRNSIQLSDFDSVIHIHNSDASLISPFNIIFR